ncbi:MAG: tripartite tricarboxylate transporter substrate binding protein [Betaproteobacteria bacterium]
MCDAKLGPLVQRLCFIFLMLLSELALAQSNYPLKPIRLIVGFPPGGATEFVARLAGQKITQSLGQPVIVDNRPGAAGNLGIELAAHAPADGYTLVLVAPNFTISPSLYKNLAYDPVRDFAPVAQLATVPMVIAIPASLPASNLKEFISLARAKPGAMNYASSGVGTSLHMAAELFKLQAGVNVVHVAYKGSSLAMNDLISGQVQMLFIGIPAPAPHIKSGRLRGLAVISSLRSATLPEVPTIAEAGMPKLEVSTWYGVLAPRGTPPSITTLLNRVINQGMQTQDVKERLAAQSTELSIATTNEFGLFIKKEVTKWAEVVKKADIKTD